MHFTNFGLSIDDWQVYNSSIEDAFLVPANGTRFRIGSCYMGNRKIRVIGITYWPKAWWKFWERKIPRYYTILWVR